MTGAEQQLANPDGEGDEAGEPEEHGQRLDGEDGEFVRRLNHEHWREGQVEQGQDGPERGEDEEIDLRRRRYIGVVVIPMCDCGQTKQSAWDVLAHMAHSRRLLGM